MVDAAEGEMPQMVHLEKKPCHGEAPPHSLEQAAGVTKVFGDDNLLSEIIVRVGLPTTLVRAALVCKRWLEHASDHAFFCRFRKLHPPRFLGYYITEESFRSRELSTHFVQMLPQLPEFAAISRRIESSNFGNLEIKDCQNGSIITQGGYARELTHVVHRPLCPERSVYNVPPVPRIPKHNNQLFSAILSKQESGRVSYLFLLGEFNKVENSTSCDYMSLDKTDWVEDTNWIVKKTTRVFILQNGAWHMLTSVTYQLPRLRLDVMPVIVDNKIYLSAASCDEIMVLDLTASSFSRIQLPQGVKSHDFMTMLSRADDASGLYLIHLKDFQLRIWLHKGNNWLLVDTICLQEMRPYLKMLDPSLEDEDTSDEEQGHFSDVHICRVGDDCQFVFLRMGPWIFYLDIKSRTLCKVYENKFDDRCFADIYPFMMIWPPTFPALKEDPARNDM